jgi:hypothetical protein
MMMMTPDLWTIYREQEMQEADIAHLDIPWSDIAKWFAAGVVAVLVWMLKQFGHQHIESIKELATELREMRKEINMLSERVRIVEVVQKHYHDE